MKGFCESFGGVTQVRCTVISMSIRLIFPIEKATKIFFSVTTGRLMKDKDSSENKVFAFVTFRNVELACKAID